MFFLFKKSNKYSFFVCTVGGANHSAHVYQHCRRDDALPERAGQASGVPGDAPMRRGTAQHTARKPTTGDQTPDLINTLERQLFELTQSEGSSET